MTRVIEMIVRVKFISLSGLFDSKIMNDNYMKLLFPLRKKFEIFSNSAYNCFPKPEGTCCIISLNIFLVGINNSS